MTPKPKRGPQEPKVLESFTMRLAGPVPSKKNAWRRRKNGGIGVDRKTAAEIQSLVMQARVQWGLRLAWGNPDMEFEFAVRSRRADRDNKYGCLLDVLQEARVIHNDNPKWNNGSHILRPVVVGKEEWTTIRLTQWRKIQVGAKSA